MTIYSIQYKYTPAPIFAPFIPWTDTSSTWSSVDTTLGDDYEVSSKLCFDFCNGRTCKRQSMDSGCPDVHNLDHRKEYFQRQAARKAELVEKIKELEEKKRVEQSRAKLQQKYNNTTEYVLKTTTVTVAKAASTPQVRVKNVASKANVNKTTLKSKFNKPQSKKRANANTVSSKAQANIDHTGPKPAVAASSPTQAAHGPAPPCKVLTIIIDDPNRVPGPNERIICPYFLKQKGCRLKDNCPRVHDAALRAASLKDVKSKKSKVSDQSGVSKVIANTRSKELTMNEKSSHTASNQHEGSKDPYSAKSKVTVSKKDDTEGPSNGLAVTETSVLVGDSQSITTYAQAIKANVVSIPRPPRPKIVQRTWNQHELAKWAFSNLKEGTVGKLLTTPHLAAGKIPTRLLATFPEHASNDAVFHLFTQLPGEIRNQIWNLILDVERHNCYIKLEYDYENRGNYYNSRMTPRSCIPRLLHVSSEARSIAMPRYEYTFATVNNAPTTPFNYANDRLTIHTSNSTELLPIAQLMVKRDLQRVTWLAVPLRDYLFNRAEFCIAITYFKKLSKLSLLVSDSREDSQWNSDEKLAPKAMNTLRVTWKKVHPKRATPKVRLEVISGLLAHGMKIDGLIWY